MEMYLLNAQLHNARYYQAVSSNRVLCVLERKILESIMTSYNSSINFYNSFQSKGTPNPTSHRLLSAPDCIPFSLFLHLYNKCDGITVAFCVCP